MRHRRLCAGRREVSVCGALLDAGRFLYALSAFLGTECCSDDASACMSVMMIASIIKHIKQNTKQRCGTKENN